MTAEIEKLLDQARLTNNVQSSMKDGLDETPDFKKAEDYVRSLMSGIGGADTKAPGFECAVRNSVICVLSVYRPDLYPLKGEK